MRLFRSTCLLLGSALLLTACGDGGSDDPTDAPPASEEGTGALPEPERIVTIEPQDGLRDAERAVVQGVGVDLPSGVTGTTTELSEDVTLLVVSSGGRDRADLSITVSRVDDVSYMDLFLAMRTFAARLPPEMVPEREEIGVSWAGLPDGWGLEGRIDPGDGEFRDFLYTAMRDEGGTRVIGITVEAPEGAVEDSIGYEMLRTVRIDEG